MLSYSNSIDSKARHITKPISLDPTPMTMTYINDMSSRTLPNDFEESAPSTLLWRRIKSAKEWRQRERVEQKNQFLACHQK